MGGISNKERVDRLLKQAHLIINNATGLDISKPTREQAKREARKVLKQIKGIDERVWGILKAEIDE